MSDLVQWLVQASIWLIYSLMLNKRLLCFFLRNRIYFISAFFVLKLGMSQSRIFWSWTLLLRHWGLLRFCAHICRKNWRLRLRTICLRTKCLRTKCLLDETSIRTKRLLAHRHRLQWKTSASPSGQICQFYVLKFCCFQNASLKVLSWFYRSGRRF